MGYTVGNSLKVSIHSSSPFHSSSCFHFPKNTLSMTGQSSSQRTQKCRQLWPQRPPWMERQSQAIKSSMIKFPIRSNDPIKIHRPQEIKSSMIQSDQIKHDHIRSQAILGSAQVDPIWIHRSLILQEQWRISEPTWCSSRSSMATCSPTPPSLMDKLQQEPARGSTAWDLEF